MSVFEDALKVATVLHKGQKCKVGKPYIFHPIRVAFEVINQGDKYMQVAVLHDTIEDCGVSAEDLISFGIDADVVEAVAILSRPPKGSENRPTYKEYIEKIKASGNRLARFVKIADLWDNIGRVHELPEKDRGIVKRYFDALRVLGGV